MSRNDPWRTCRQSELTGGHYFRRKRARLMEDKQPSHPEQASRAAPLCLRAKYEKNGSIVSDTEDSVRSDNGRLLAWTLGVQARRRRSQLVIVSRPHINLSRPCRFSRKFKRVSANKRRLKACTRRKTFSANAGCNGRRTNS